MGSKFSVSRSLSPLLWAPRRPDDTLDLISGGVQMRLLAVSFSFHLPTRDLDERNLPGVGLKPYGSKIAMS